MRKVPAYLQMEATGVLRVTLGRPRAVTAQVLTNVVRAALTARAADGVHPAAHGGQRVRGAFADDDLVAFDGNVLGDDEESVVGAAQRPLLARLEVAVADADHVARAVPHGEGRGAAGGFPPHVQPEPDLVGRSFSVRRQTHISPSFERMHQ